MSETLSYEQIPKVELHCHLDGIVDPAMLREVREQGLTLPMSPETLAGLYPVTTFEEFVRWHEGVQSLEGSLEAFQPLLAVHLERLKTQRVFYTEIMIGSSEIPRDRAELVGRMRAFREWVNRQEDGEIQVEFLAVFGRNRTPERAEELADRFLMLHEAGLLAGVALAGPERGHPVRPFRKTFARLHEAGVKIEIHAGEWCGPESVWDALEHGFPDRIGHGVAIFQDRHLLRRFQEEQIPLEMCPTSNVKTGSVPRIEAHPVRQARELGLNFSLNTDDPGTFECSMVTETRLLAERFGFGVEDFTRIRQNSLAARFQPELRVSVPV